jgi:hypothetical protein
MSKEEQSRVVYVSNDGKLQVLHELTPAEYALWAAGIFELPSLPLEGTW